MKDSLEGIIVWTAVASLFLLAITTLTFIRYSLRNIDARMKADGVMVPWESDRTGLRAGFSAYIIALPIKKYEGQIDVFASLRSIKPYATKADKRWAMAMIVSEFIFMAVVAVGVVYGPSGSQAGLQHFLNTVSASAVLRVAMSAYLAAVSSG